MSSRDIETLMWAQACEALDRAERLQRQFFRPGVARTRRPVWQPPVDIFEGDETLQIVAALPGVDRDHLEVAFQDNLLVISGERTLPPGTGGHAIQRLEIPQGHFERRIQLTPGSYRIQRRELVNGCLYLTLGKQEVRP